MPRPYPVCRFLMGLVVAASTLVFATAALADTIYLKNGRTIRSSQVRVEGDRVIFLQYGGEVTLPLALVERIEEDDNVEPESSPPPTAPVAPAPAPANEPAAPPDDEAAGGRSRAEWRELISAIEAERQQIDGQIQDLRRTERAFLFAHRSTAPTRRLIEAAQARLVELDEEMTALRRQARSAGVPAGWLRPPRRETGGGGDAG